jgi:hypothetical protein
MCSRCGQTTQKISAGMILFVPCSCPVDQEAFNKRMDYLKNWIEELKVKVYGEKSSAL